MSAIVLLPVIIPGAAAAWPVIATAAAAAAAAMGFASTSSATSVEAESEVELSVSEAATVTQDVALGEALVFEREGVNVTFFRDTSGKVAVKVRGSGKTDSELRAIGQKMADTLTQQYAYHQLMTELKQRNLNVVEEEVEEDGTVRLHVRVYQG